MRMSTIKIGEKCGEGFLFTGIVAQELLTSWHSESMAERAQAVPENVPGPFFVDTTCIDCDTCRQLAPATFGETGEFSFVQRQPATPEETRAALRALIACPTGS